MSALPQTAVALTPACKSVADPAARLACYDNTAAPAASAATTRPAVATAPVSKPDPANYVDSIGTEDALMNAKLKNIYRGC
jgi:hypothetical protein